jgi:hypothetical protein
MKVTGPGPESTAGPPDADPAARPSGGAGAVGREDDAFAKTLDRTLEAGRAQGPAGHEAAATGPAERLTADLAAELQAGRIDARAAVERLVERVIDSQVGAHAPAAVRDSLRATLREALESDPFLAEKLRRLQAE